jgi:hypothetical protein
MEHLMRILSHRSRGWLLLVLAVLAIGFPVVFPREIRTAQPGGTYPGRVLDEIAKHKYNQRQIERAVKNGQLEFSGTGPVTLDVGDIAVIQDDGSLISGSRSPFDLKGRSLRWLPRTQGGFDVSIDNTVVDQNYKAAVTIRDDDSLPQTLPFGFTFYGISYSAVFLNSDGNLTFGSGDSASSDRSLSRFRTGAPRIAGFFTDLNPEQGGKVYADITPQKAMFTWV